MAVTYGFFNSVNGDRKYDADQMSAYFRGIVTQGVFQSLDGGLAVTAGTGLAVNVATGRAIVQDKWVNNDLAMTLTISDASATYPRYDAVVIKYDGSARTVSIYVKAGTPAASPSYPTMTRSGTTYEMCLAYVSVPANATSVTVTDKRSDTSVCGWATVAQSISGTYEAMIDDMKTGFDGVVYNSPGAAVRGSDEKLQTEIGDNAYITTEKYSAFRTRSIFEAGAYEIVDNELREKDTSYTLAANRRSEVFKVPEYTQFFVSDSNFKGMIYETPTSAANWATHNWLVAGDRKWMPMVESYVAVDVRATGETIPTTDDCMRGFYLQYPFQTDDYPEITERQINDIAKPISGRFIIGAMSNGTPSLASSNRIVYPDLISYDADIIISVATGFRYGLHIWNGSSYYDPGWQTGQYELKAGQQFKIIIARTSEQTETADKWFVDFVNAVTVTPKAIKNLPDNISLTKQFMYSSRPKFGLHRGLSAQAPENSAPAFELAGQGGAWAIETDVYETTDGRFICIHDSTVDRTTDGTGNVLDKSFAEIEALTIDVGPNIDQYPNLKIPTFEEYLGICKTYGCVALIEIKGVTHLDNFINAIKQYGMYYNSIIIGWKGLIKILRNGYDPKITLPIVLNGYQYDESYQDLVDYAKDYDNMIVSFEPNNNFTDALIASAHSYNLTVGVWTIDSEEAAKGYFARGVDFVMSNSLTKFSE